MVKILVIDDLRIFDDFEAVYARTLSDGFKKLLEPWDIVYLDHDLGEDDIRPIVLAIAEAAFVGKPYQIGQIYVCSDNPSGRDWIIGTLEKYYPIMFRQPRFHVDWDETPA